jgi:hypothetical protein
LGCMFDGGARCPHPVTYDGDDFYVGCRAVPDGTCLNLLTHIPMELDYGVAMSHFVRHGLGRFSFLYEGEPQLLMMKVRYHSPFIETAREDGQIPRHSLANFLNPLMEYIFVHDGVRLEVLDHDGADHITVTFMIIIMTHNRFI